MIDAGADRFWIDMRDIIFADDRLDNARAEARDALDRIGLVAPAHVLDVGCGIGRHSRALAQLGYVATGIDQVSYYIDEARRLAEGDRPRPTFITADIVRYDGLKPGSFDAAICLYHSLGYDAAPESDLAALQRVRRALKPGGAMILDLIDPEAFSPDECRESQFEAAHGRVQRTIRVNTARDKYEIVFAPEYSPNTHYRARHRLFSADRIKELLLQAGFARTQIGEALSGSYAKGSRRMTVTAFID
ncbi:MAG: class I SAM-dependent methyltransferase [Paracoccaceae bacterium]|nr:class I SAM-dependent methyltransferase [Paracoccaceae bacterium]